MSDVGSRINQGLKGIHPYVPGKSREEISRERGLSDVIKMASNENALGMSPRAMEAVSRRLSRGAEYPEVSTPELRKALAEYTGLDPERIITGNGADGVIYTLAMTLLSHGDEAIIPAITFPMYESAVRAMGATVVRSGMIGYHIDLDDILGRLTDRTRVIWLCNPNNPTGTSIDRDQVHTFLDRIPQTVWVIHDEVYHDFADTRRFPDVGELLKRHPNVFCIRSFSKVYGMAGLRLGYGMGSAELVSWMYRVRPPFDVSVLAEAAGIAALGDEEFYNRTLKTVEDGKSFLYDELQRLGLTYIPSDTNFILVDTGQDDRDLAERLIARGVIVRPAGAYGLPGHLRITIGTMEQNRRIIEALTLSLGREDS